MRTLYREKRWFCGDYLEVDIYPVFKMQAGRSHGAKSTAERKLVRLLNTNFTSNDYEVLLHTQTEISPKTMFRLKRIYRIFSAGRDIYTRRRESS